MSRTIKFKLTLTFSKADGRHARLVWNSEILTAGRLVSGRLSLGWVNFNAPFKVSAVFDAYARRGNVSDDGTVPPDINAATRVNIADHSSEGDHIAGVNFGSELRVGTDREFVSLQRNRPIHDAINLQIFVARDLAFDLNAGAETRNVAGRVASNP